jgi:hypothetical protein
MMLTQTSKRNVLAATHNRLRRGQLSQLVTQRERVVQELRKLPLPYADWKQAARFFMLSRDCKTSNLTFDE